MKLRPNLLDERSPEGIEVVQLTTEEDVSGSHIYMEAQIFTPDSRRLVLHRSATPHGSDKDDPEHRYLLCDLESHGELSPLTHETGATGPSISPDGRWLYYFVNETEPGGGRLTLRRVGLDGSDRETICVLDEPLPGTQFRPGRIYPLSTISSDGKRVAISGFLGDGKRIAPSWGLMVFDLTEATVELVIHGPSLCNMHPQYCRSLNAEASRDIMIQENHGNESDPLGRITKLTGGRGADIHVIRDDGTDFRTMPWGRDGNEFCQGHQCWRGRSQWAITSTSTRDVGQAQLIEGRAVRDAGHMGLNTPGAIRNDLTREFPEPHFYHFGTDIEGTRLVSDAGPLDRGGAIYLARLGKPGEEPLRDFRYLISPRSSCSKDAHIHPFLSPDGTMAFFNSDESGLLQAYMIRGL